MIKVNDNKKLSLNKSSYINLYEVRIIDLIQKRLGIVIHNHQKTELYNTFQSACKKFHYTPDEYIQLLTICDSQSALLEELILDITVGETYFYRDKNQMGLLQNKILPTLIAQKREKNDLSLRIWSAGCASGEELYTIAIMLDGLLDDINQWNISLLGTDINTSFLKKAISGQYAEWSMRSIPKKIRDMYFTSHHNKLVLLEKICKMARFDYVNLNENTYPSIFNGTNSQDLILCRNVLIYFDRNCIIDLMNRLYACLQVGGYLLLGASDPIETKCVKSDFKYVDSMLFMRTQELPIQIKHEVKKVKPINLPAQQHYLVNKQKANLPFQPKAVNKDEILELINNAEWQTVLILVETMDSDESKNSFFQYAKAAALANLGQLNQAVKLFRASLEHDPTNKYSHFTYALTLLELNLLNEAEEEFRKTIFLDRNFVIGHYQLGLLMLRNKQIKAGLKCLNNAYEISLSKSPADQVHGSKGLCYGRLSEILKHEISMYSGA